MDTKTVQNRIKALRKQNGLTQEALASRVNVTRQTIIAVEKGRFTPSVRLALEIAQVFDLALEEVFWLEEEKGVSS